MNGPELRLARALLGMSIDRTAQLLEVNRRTVRRWEHSEATIPGYASEFMAGRLDMRDLRLSAVLEFIAELRTSGRTPESIELTLYTSEESQARGEPGMSLTEHTAAVAAVYDILRTEGIPAEVHFSAEEP